MLFSDLRGFTSSAEYMPAENVIKVLNYYLHEMSEAILAHGGTLRLLHGRRHLRDLRRADRSRRTTPTGRSPRATRDADSSGCRSSTSGCGAGSRRRGTSWASASTRGR